MTADDSKGLRMVAEPQQRRSIATTERMMAVTEELLLRQGESFTLGEVAKVGRLSMSSIYARFRSKDELVCAVQKRTFHDMSQEIDQQLERLKLQGGDLDWTVSRIVHIMAEAHLRRAKLINAFHISAPANTGLRDSGSAFFGTLVDTATATMLPLCDDRADPLWINWVWRVALYAIAGKLGANRGVIPDFDEEWNLFKRALAGTIVASLV